MEPQIKHARVITTTPVMEGIDEIRTDNYLEKLKSTKVETRQRILSTDTTILSDYLRCLDVITGHISGELTIHIERNGNEIRMEKVWTVSKLSHGL